MLTRAAAGLALGLTIVIGASAANAQQAGHGAPHGQHPSAAPSELSAARAQSPATTPPAHEMWMQPLGDGWNLMGMAQVFPAMTAASPWRDESLLNASGLYATQPAAMLNIASPRERLVLRTTLNFEAWTQRDGELTFGGWGEGFIDARHPHTLLHEAMLTANWWDVGGGAL